MDFDDRSKTDSRPLRKWEIIVISIVTEFILFPWLPNLFSKSRPLRKHEPVVVSMFIEFILFPWLPNFFRLLQDPRWVVGENYLPLYIKRAYSYGKCAYKEKCTSSMEPMQVPKKWYKHFYICASFLNTFALYLMISSLIFGMSVHPIILDVLVTVSGSNTKTSVTGVSALLAMCIFTLHCYRRLYETHFVSVFSNNGRMSLSYYIFAIIHYIAVMLAILVETPTFTKTSSLKGYDLYWTDLTLIDVAAGMLLFWISWHQHSIATILSNLRRDENGITITETHKLPHGDWFQYVSSPHYLAEMLIYLLLKVILWNNSTWTYVVIWVLVNQTQASISSHRWYQRTFKEMPKERRMILPFIY